MGSDLDKTNYRTIIHSDDISLSLLIQMMTYLPRVHFTGIGKKSHTKDSRDILVSRKLNGCSFFFFLSVNIQMWPSICRNAPMLFFILFYFLGGSFPPIELINDMCGEHCSSFL